MFCQDLEELLIVQHYFGLYFRFKGCLAICHNSMGLGTWIYWSYFTLEGWFVLYFPVYLGFGPFQYFIESFHKVMNYRYFVLIFLIPMHGTFSWRYPFKSICKQSSSTMAFFTLNLIWKWATIQFFGGRSERQCYHFNHFLSNLLTSYCYSRAASWRWGHCH